MSHENLYQRGNAWYYSFKLNKQRFRGSCFTHRLDEAKRVLRQKMAEAEATPEAVTVATTRHMTVAAMRAWDFDRAILKRSRKDVIDTTLGCIWRRVGAAFEHAGEMTADAVAVYARHHMEAGLSTQTIKRDLWAIKRAHEEAARRDPALPALGKLPKLGVDDPGKTQGQLVPLDVARQWLSLLKTPASRAQVVVALLTGIRFEEMRRLRTSWLKPVEVDGRAWCIVRMPRAATKGKKAREVAVHPAVADLIREFSPFVTDYRSAWSTASRKLGLTKPISMRDLRVTFGTYMGAYDFAGTKLVMGHTSDKRDAVAMLYQRVDDERLCRLAAEAARVFAFALPGATLGATGGSNVPQAQSVESAL